MKDIKDSQFLSDKSSREPLTVLLGYMIVFYTLIAKATDHLYPYLNERNEHDERNELDPEKKREIFRSVRQMFILSAWQYIF